MAVYDKNGNSLLTVYDAEGNVLTQAYDIDGNPLLDQNPTRLKVMSYNVGGWYIGDGTYMPASSETAYRNLHVSMIQNADPDILCIQEYRKQFSQSGTQAIDILSPLFPYYEIRQDTTTYYGHAIFSKYPISNYVTHSYTGDSNRYYDSCTVTIDGEELTVVNTHFHPTDASQRVAEVAQLLPYLETLDTFICCGDYNMIDCKTTEGADYIAIIEPILGEGYHSANCTDFGFLETFKNITSGWTGCLDNIVTSSDITILQAYVDTTKLTDSISGKIDHMPLIATLQL